MPLTDRIPMTFAVLTTKKVTFEQDRPSHFMLSRALQVLCSEIQDHRYLDWHDECGCLGVLLVPPPSIVARQGEKPSSSNDSFHRWAV